MKREYGIRDHRSNEIHRRKMTETEAVVWMTEDWGDIDPSKVFEIVWRERQIGEWQRLDETG